MDLWIEYIYELRFKVWIQIIVVLLLCLGMFYNLNKLVWDLICDYIVNGDKCRIDGWIY